jgi:hypothetical protein
MRRSCFGSIPNHRPAEVIDRDVGHEFSHPGGVFAGMSVPLEPSLTWTVRA